MYSKPKQKNRDVQVHKKEEKQVDSADGSSSADQDKSLLFSYGTIADWDVKEKVSSLLERGDSLGRLEIGEVLGHGAFGVVVAAYDPRLKRKLAIKLLRPEVFDSRHGRHAQKRLLLEARMMAMIDHPNVVTVHDIGMVDGQIYIAMEFVEGGSLRHWLLNQEPNIADILDIFEKAGRGLYAAHQKGLVHRDFKPSNVLVDDKKNVRVADFGLVRFEDDSLTEEDFTTKGGKSTVSLNTNMQTGSCMGTALFMSPEQHNGGKVSAASDQFSYCVSLYWALYKQEPYDYVTYEELKESVLAWKVKEPLQSSAVLKRLYPILKKGLSPNAQDRYTSMEELLCALFLNRESKRRILPFVLVGAVGMVIVVCAAFWFQSQSSVACESSSRFWEQEWTPAREEMIRQNFKQGGREVYFSALHDNLQEYSQQWATTRTEVCKATRVRGEQSERLLDLRMHCLDLRWNYFRYFLTNLEATLEGKQLDKAAIIASQFSDVSVCTNLTALTDRTPKQEEQTLVDAFLQKVEEATVHQDLGQPKEAIVILESILDTPVAFEPALAKATQLLGKCLIDVGNWKEGEDALRRSIELATRSEDDLSVAGSWLALVHLEGALKENYKKAHEHADMAKLAFIRHKAEASDFAVLDVAIAGVLIFEGKAKEALSLLEKSVSIVRSSGDVVRLARVLSKIGDVKRILFDFSGSKSSYEESLLLTETILGKTHPENIVTLNNMGILLKASGDMQGSQISFERVVALIEQNDGKDSTLLPTVFSNLGNIFRREGKLDKAIKVFERGLEIGSHTLEVDHPVLIKLIMNMALVYLTKSDTEKSLSLLREAVTMTASRFKQDHPLRAKVLNNLAGSLISAGKAKEALLYLIPSLEMKERIYGKGDPNTAGVYIRLGRAYDMLGKFDLAQHYYQGGVAMCEKAMDDDNPAMREVLSITGRFYQKHGRSKKALVYLRRVIGAYGEKRTGDVALLDRFTLLLALHQTGKKKEARKNARDLLLDLQDPKNESLRKKVKKWIEKR